jgi:predicted HicB family RNase H-like nuclease
MAKKIATPDVPKLGFRFKSREHYDQVVAAAKARGLSINAWIVQATIMQAEAQASEVK